MTNDSQFIIYQTADGSTKLEVRLEQETVWLNQRMMAELFQTTIPNINLHLKNVFEEGELDEAATIKDFLIVQQEGNRSVERSGSGEVSFYQGIQEIRRTQCGHRREPRIAIGCGRETLNDPS